MGTGVWLAALLVGGAVWLVVPTWKDDRTRGISGAAHRGGPARAAAWGRRRVVWAGGRVGMGPASRRRRARDRIRVVQALGALAADLQAGLPPASALLGSGGDPSAWPATEAAIRLDGDVLAGLAIDARAQPVLRQLGACWQVGSTTGAGLALAVRRLAASARAAEDVRVGLESQLAGPRATARMLAVLPAVGVAFGSMLGSDPLSWLLTTTAGWMCLTAGLGLTAVGMSWTARIARRVEMML